MPKPTVTKTKKAAKKRGRGRPRKSLPKSPLKTSSPSSQKPRGRPRKEDSNKTISLFDPRLPPPPPPPPPVNNPFYQKFVKEYWEKNYDLSSGNLAPPLRPSGQV